MRKFKRSTKFIVTSFLLGITFPYAIRLILLGCQEGNLFENTLTPADFALGVEFLFFLVVFVIAHFALPPDFEYCIRIYNDWAIFEFSEKYHVRLNKDFTIVNKKKRYLLLDDGYSRIQIAYNKEVLKFLNEINKY